MDHIAETAAELVAQFQREDSTDALDQAIALYEGEPALLAPYGRALLLRHVRHARDEDLDAAVAACLAALEQTPPDAEERPDRLVDAADALIGRWDARADPADMETAIGLFRQAMEIQPDSVRARSKLGVAIARRRVGGGGSDGDLAEALTLCRDALAPDADGSVERRSRLAFAMFARAGESGDSALLDSAIEMIGGALDATPLRSPDRWAYELLRASMIFQRHTVSERAEDLAEAIESCAAVLARMPANAPGRRLGRLQYGVMLLVRFRRTDDPGDRDQAITMLRDALTGFPPWTPSRPAHEQVAHEQLRSLLWNRVGSDRRLEDVDEIIARVNAALAVAPDDELRQELASASITRYSITGRLADLPADSSRDPIILSGNLLRACTGTPAELGAAIAVADEVLAAAPGDEDDLLSLRLAAGRALMTRYGQTADPGDLDRSIDLFEQAADSMPADSYTRGVTRADVARGLAVRFDMASDPADLEAALAAADEAARLVPEGHPDRAGVENARGHVLTVRYHRGGDPADLEAAIAAHRASVDATPATHPDRVVYEAILGRSLQERSETSGDPADNAAAVRAAESALRAVPAGGVAHGERLVALARARSQQFLLTGDAEAVDASIAAYQQAAGELPPGHPTRKVVLSGLTAALKVRAEQTGSLADLDAAVAAGQEAARLRGRVSDQATAAINLADALRMRSVRTGGRADADAAVTVIREAAQGLAEGDRQRPLCLVQLALSLSHRFTLSGDPADIDTSVDLARSVLTAFPNLPPARLIAYSTLAAALWERALHWGDLNAMTEAIETMDTAIAEPAADHRQRVSLLYNKAGMLMRRFDLYGRPADLDEAIEANRTALAALPPNHPHRPIVTKGLALLYSARYLATDQDDDLKELIRLGQDGLAATPDDDPAWASHQHVAGHGLLMRFWRSGRNRDLWGAIRALQASVTATPRDHPILSGRASQLGLALNTRYERYGRYGRRRDMERAMAAFRLSTEVTSASTSTRLTNTRMYAAYNLHHERPVEALEHYRVCVQELLPLAAWRGLDRYSQQNQLKEVAGLACEAAAAALACGSPRSAVQLLEQGRGVLWAQLLETRTDRNQLRERHPELAAEFDRLCAVLDSRDGERQGPETLQGDGLGGPREWDSVDRRRRVTARFAELRDHIRQLPDFDRFLRPPDFTALREAAAEGPVVIVNVDDRRCDALLLTADDLRVLPLPRLTHEDAVQRARAFHDALATPPAGVAARIAATQTVLSTLEWLWDTTARPILDALGLRDTPGEATRRIWWYPTGPLSTLPLHAAGRHLPDQPAEWVGDHVVSSYTPTLQALLRARGTAPADDLPATLVVGLRTTPRSGDAYADLPAVPGEVRAVRDALGERVTVLEDGAATRQAVLGAIPGHPRAHFACHGSQNPEDPSASHLALHDGELTVLDLARTGAAEGELAFLSACETAQGDPALADESIHLAAAFQLAGYRHVIGTLWRLNDASAAELAGEVYGRLAAGEGPAIALHQAVRRLRGIAGFGSPVSWAPYVHIGP